MHRWIPGAGVRPPSFIQSPDMGDWFRSATVLVMAFVGAVVVTIGLANVIVPGRPAGPQTEGTSDGAPRSPAQTLQPIIGVGGHLTVTGDREGTLTLTRESNDERYSLVGNDARIVFEGNNPPEVAQVSWEGLEFFPEPGDCAITPGALDDEIGVGYAEIECEGLTDIRGGGTISLSGMLGLPLTTVGESDLPEMGGSVAVGDETWAFVEAFLFTFPVNSGAGTDDFNMELADADGGTLRFRFDVQTHRLTLIGVEREGEASELPPGACNLATNELGRLAPNAAVVELTIECPAAEVPGLGTVPITGTVTVQQLDFVP
jgi:hypothetical protein